MTSIITWLTTYAAHVDGHHRAQLLAAADTIEALRADLADLPALKRDIANALRDLTAEATENIALRAQVAELQKDADKYFDAGWALCCAWADRDDLMYDLDSPAHLAERNAAISAITEAPHAISAVTGQTLAG